MKKLIIKFYFKQKKSLLQTAQMLGLSRSNLYYKMNKLGLKCRTIKEVSKGKWQGKNNPCYGKIGKNHPAYKHGGKFYCIDCGKQIDYRNKKCRKCYHKIRTKNLIGKKRPEHSKRMMGKNNPAYINGLSRLPYNLQFNDQLKLKIRQRDNFECQYCNKSEKREKKQLNRKLTVHHIDYNKANLKEKNLITLCHKCNILANTNRNYWYVYYTYVMENYK